MGTHDTEGVILRRMMPEEAQEVKHLGRRAFTGLEGWFAGKPADAVVAVCDGRIVGAAVFKYIASAGKTTAYIDYAYVVREYQSTGVGRVMYEYAFSYLMDKGCDCMTALVKDDNVGSWHLLLKNGFVRAGLVECVRRKGLHWTAKQFFKTPLSIAIGMDFYLYEKEAPPSKSGGMKQLALYFAVSLVFILLASVYCGAGWISFIAAAATAMLLRLLAGYMAILPDRNGWSFRLCNGGAFVCALVSLVGSIYPMIGGWYPDKYEDTETFRRRMGINGAAQWCATALCVLPYAAGFKEYAYFKYLAQVGSVFLLYTMLLVYPFEAFGGGRVFRWSRWVFVLLFAISAIMLWITL